MVINIIVLHIEYIYNHFSININLYNEIFHHHIDSSYLHPTLYIYPLKYQLLFLQIFHNNSLKINFEEGNFDENFLENLVKVYNKNKNKDFLEPYINKIINTEEINLNQDCIYIIYKFYKKYNDIKALDRLCKYMYKNQ